jgi:hypothetical protein
MSLDDITEEQLQMVEDMGAVLFNPEEAALAIGIDVGGFLVQMDDVTSDIYKRYHKGRLLAMYKVRKNVFDMAANGSGPAQQLVEKYVKEYGWKEKLKEAQR